MGKEIQVQAHQEVQDLENPSGPQVAEATTPAVVEDQAMEELVVEDHPIQAQDKVQTPTATTTRTTMEKIRTTKIHRPLTKIHQKTKDPLQTDSTSG